MTIPKRGWCSQEVVYGGVGGDVVEGGELGASVGVGVDEGG